MRTARFPSSVGSAQLTLPPTPYPSPDADTGESAHPPDADPPPHKADP